MRLLYTTAIAAAMAGLLFYLAVIFAFDYNFTGPRHYIALLVGSPFILASYVYSDVTATVMALAFLVYFGFSFLLLVGCHRVWIRFRRVKGK